MEVRERCLGVLCDHTERGGERHLQSWLSSPFSYYSDIVAGWQSLALLLAATSGLILPLYISAVSVAVMGAFV